MTPITIVGMVAGSLLIVTAGFVFATKKEFPAGGVGVTLVGLVLIGMSQWTTIKIKGAGFDIDLSTIRTQLAETARAVDAVAEQTVHTAAATETTRHELLALAGQLETRQLVSPATAASLRRSLTTIPRVDTMRVNAARGSLRVIIRP